MVGIRSLEYTYSDDELMDNTEYFKKCFYSNLSAYKALLFLRDHKDDNRQNTNSRVD